MSETSEIDSYVRAIFKKNRTIETRIAALVAYVEGALSDETVYHETGIPGGITSEDEIAPGVTAYRNGNGSIVAVELAPVL